MNPSTSPTTVVDTASAGDRAAQGSATASSAASAVAATSTDAVGGGAMPAGDGKLPDAIAAAQLNELNQRVRMHANRLWQLPFAFFGLVVVLLSGLNTLQGAVLTMASAFLLTVGTIVLWCMLGAYEGVCRGSSEIGLLEHRLGLRKTVGVQPDWLEALAMRYMKRLTWHFVPYFLLAIVSLAAVGTQCAAMRGV